MPKGYPESWLRGGDEAEANNFHDEAEDSFFQDVLNCPETSKRDGQASQGAAVKGEDEGDFEQGRDAAHPAVLPPSTRAPLR